MIGVGIGAFSALLGVVRTIANPRPPSLPRRIGAPLAAEYCRHAGNRVVLLVTWNLEHNDAVFLPEDHTLNVEEREFVPRRVCADGLWTPKLAIVDPREGGGGVRLRIASGGMEQILRDAQLRQRVLIVDRPQHRIYVRYDGVPRVEELHISYFGERFKLRTSESQRELPWDEYDRIGW
jgi:hypothetical protein